MKVTSLSDCIHWILNSSNVTLINVFHLQNVPDADADDFCKVIIHYVDVIVTFIIFNGNEQAMHSLHSIDYNSVMLIFWILFEKRVEIFDFSITTAEKLWAICSKLLKEMSSDTSYCLMLMDWVLIYPIHYSWKVFL